MAPDEFKNLGLEFESDKQGTAALSKGPEGNETKSQW